MEESIFHFRYVRLYDVDIPKEQRLSYLQAVETQIRRRVLRCLGLHCLPVTRLGVPSLQWVNLALLLLLLLPRRRRRPCILTLHLFCCLLIIPPIYPAFHIFQKVIIFLAHLSESTLCPSSTISVLKHSSFDPILMKLAQNVCLYEI